MCGRLDQRTLGQWTWESVPRHKELGVTEILDGANRQDHLLAGTLDRLELPIELAGVELVGPGFDLIPVGRHPNQVERIGQERVQRCRSVQAERLNLSRAKTESQQGSAATRDQ